jgi:hypothetical protein
MPRSRRTTLPKNYDDWWERTQAQFAIMMPRRKRLMMWLEKAAKTADKYPDHPYIKGIVIQREGGYEYNKDLRFLVEKGLLKMERHAYSKGWGGDYDLRVTTLAITDLGRTALKHGSI